MLLWMRCKELSLIKSILWENSHKTFSFSVKQMLKTSVPLKNPVKLLILQTIRIPKDQLQYFKRYEKSAKSCRFVQLPLTHDLEILDPEIVPANFGSKKLWNNLSGPLIVSLHLFIYIINPTSVCLHPLHNLFWTKSWPVPFFVVFYKINLVLFTNSYIIKMYYHRFKRRKGQ